MRKLKAKIKDFWERFDWWGLLFVLLLFLPGIKVLVCGMMDEDSTEIFWGLLLVLAVLSIPFWFAIAVDQENQEAAKGDARKAERTAEFQKAQRILQESLRTVDQLIEAKPKGAPEIKERDDT